MKTLSGFCVVLLATGAAFAQNRSGFVNSRGIVRAPSSVVFPGGTSAMPGVQRTTGSILYPGGGGPQIGIPGTPYARPNTGRPTGRRHTGGVAYAYPIYVGGYPEIPYAEPAPQQQPNVTVIYPPQQAPVIINHFGAGDGQYAGPATRIFEAPNTQAAVQEAPAEAEHYLIAFKDRSVYSAVAYWVDGETLHYFTSGNTHNQASVSLVDRDLTAKLNQGTGHEVKLPAAR